MFRLPPTSFAIDRRFHIRVVSIIRQPLSSSIQLNSNSLFHFHCHKLRNLLRSHKDARLISEAHDTTIPGAHLQAHSHALSLSHSRTHTVNINNRYQWKIRDNVHLSNAVLLAVAGILFIRQT